NCFCVIWSYICCLDLRDNTGQNQQILKGYGPSTLPLRMNGSIGRTCPGPGSTACFEEATVLASAVNGLPES
ncbi:hypothetical protein T03_782, partial [Trichinella britovi]